MEKRQLFQKQKIMIRPVINLPKQTDTVKEESETAEVYDPFQLTDEELDKRRVEEAYDPFEPTLSDNDSAVMANEVKSPDQLEGLNTPEFQALSPFKQVEGFKLKKSPPVCDFDIEQMLDSQFNESFDTKKTSDTQHAAANIGKQVSKSSSDFDIFAEEELEKAQAAAKLPSDDASLHPGASQKTSSRFDKLSDKIKSAFAAESDPTVTSNQKTSDFGTADKTEFSSDEPTDNHLLESESSAANIGLKEPDNIVGCEDDKSNGKALDVIQLSEELKQNNSLSLNRKSRSKSPTQKSSKIEKQQSPDQSKSLKSEKSSFSSSHKKHKSRSKERQNVEKSKKKRSYRNRSRSRSKTPEEAGKKSRRSRSRSRHRSSRKKYEKSRSRSPRKDRKRRRSRSESRGRSYGGRYRSRSRSKKRDKRKRSRSRHRSSARKTDKSLSKSPKKDAKKSKHSRSTSKERRVHSKSDRKKSSNKSKSSIVGSKLSIPEEEEEEDVLTDIVMQKQPDKSRASKESSHTTSGKPGETEVAKSSKESAGKKSKADKVNDGLETHEKEDRNKFENLNISSVKKASKEKDDLKRSDSYKFEEKGCVKKDRKKSETEKHNKKKLSKDGDQKKSEKREKKMQPSEGKESFSESEHEKHGDHKLSKEIQRQHSEKDNIDSQDAFEMQVEVSEKHQRSEKRKHSKDSNHYELEKKGSKKNEIKHADEQHQDDQELVKNKNLKTVAETYNIKDHEKDLKDHEKVSKDHAKYSDDEDAAYQKSTKKKKKKKYEKDYEDDDEIISSKKKKKHKKYDRLSSDSEPKSVKKHKPEARKDKDESNEERKSKKKKKKRHSSLDEGSDAYLGKYKEENKSHKHSKKHQLDKKDIRDAKDMDLRKASTERKHGKKKHKKDYIDIEELDYEDKATTKKKKKKKRASKDTTDIFDDIDEKEPPSPQHKKSLEITSVETQAKKVGAENLDVQELLETSAIEKQSVDEFDVKVNVSLAESHLTLPVQPSLVSNLDAEPEVEKTQTPERITQNELPVLADSSQELDIDYLLEESLKKVPSSEEITPKSNTRRISNQLSDKALRSPSPMSPSLLSPASSHPENDVSSQNSSMITSSQDFKETPSYAETFLEQSRKRWEKSYRNKSPHIASTLTPDESTVDVSAGKSGNQALKINVSEQSSLSDIFADPKAKLKMSERENTAAETSSASAEDIFKVSPPHKSKQEENLRNVSFELEMQLGATVPIKSSANLESNTETVLSITDKLSQDTDLRVLLEKINSNNLEPGETRTDATEKPVINESENIKQVKEDKKDEKSSKKRKRSSSPKRKSSSSSPSRRRHSERKRSDRHRRSRSRSRERRSRYRRSSSRSPRRRSTYDSHRRRDSNRDRRRNTDRNRSPEHRRYSSEKTRRLEPQPETPVSTPQIPLQPASELLNKFLEQTTAFIPLLQQQQAVEKAPETKVTMSPQPIATISGISSATFSHDQRHDELGQAHDLAPTSFPNLVNESRPALIQIPTIDSHTSETKEKVENVEKKESPKEPEGIVIP